MQKLYVDFNLDYIVGHLRSGHKEGEIELTDEEYADFLEAENKENFLLSLKEEEIFDLKLILDDYEIDDCGRLSLFHWEEC